MKFHNASTWKSTSYKTFQFIRSTDIHKNGKIMKDILCIRVACLKGGHPINEFLSPWPFISLSYSLRHNFQSLTKKS